MQPTESDVPVRLPIRRVVIVGPDGLQPFRSTVHCPLKRSQAVSDCLSCQRLRDADEHALRCQLPAGVVSTRSLVGALIPEETVVLDAELSAKEALALLNSSHAPSAPVVDDNDTLLGVVFTSELIGLAHSPHAEVEDALAPAVAVGEQVTVHQLVQLMESRNLERVQVVDEVGHLVGVVSALDVVRWYSRTFCAPA
ncbi:MAG: CBS domain-containing protein [Myxococcaceae bacterium]|nr:CBS domain-containing protein [Myxococcaceae bacterium]